MTETALKSDTELVTDWLGSLAAALERRDVERGARAVRRRLLLARPGRVHLEHHDAGGQGTRSARCCEATLADVQPSRWQIEGEASEAGGVTEAWFTFETGRRARPRPPAAEGRQAAGRC